MERPGGTAIRYDGPGAKPQAVSVLRGALAEAIVALAKQHQIALHEDAGLVEALARLEIGAAIPHELLAVVAEVLAVVYAADGAASPAP